jgi:glycosyltransferase involved in cell wall biosynthesis
VDSLKILKLSYEFPPVGGGGSKVAYGLASSLVDKGHSIDIVTMAYDDLPKHEVVDGIGVYRIPCMRKSVDRCHPHEMAIYLLRAIPELQRLCKSNSYDLVHCHFIMPDGFLGLWLQKKLGLPLVVTAHGSDVPGYNPDRFQLWHKIIAPIWRTSVCRIDAIVCPSQYLEGLITESEPRANTVTIPNGFDTDRLDPNRPRKDRILVLTRMLERKGVQDVLRALVEPGIDFEVDIVGTGSYLDELIKLNAELGTNANFHGWLDNDSSELRDLTDQTGCREVVGNAALKVPPGNPAAIREALDRLINDRNLCKQLGRDARARLEQNFSWQSVTNSYLETFRDLVAKSTR